MATASGGVGPATPPIPAEVGAPAAPARPEYEFNEAEDRIILDLGSKMSFVGLFMVGIGLCFAVSAVQRWSRFQEFEVGLLFLTMLFMVFGVWTHRAGRDFGRVAESRGRDVAHLMSALSSLLNCYRLIYLIFFVGLIFALIQLAATNLGG
ncbi:hypothetical protein [Paludisphaera mucosa]|uniref:Uncharacterized protein n=1 Tax=Paludisphaera mucosa TaxID=3030827 RepID=A0ABT6FCD3_9BACT|nr:hypothetical protein [Paludisphaera mucosa]MDG3005250.1 hypothetical protein [Paludisphaera mucosa]